MRLDEEEKPIKNSVFSRKNIKEYRTLTKLGYDAKYVQSAMQLYAVSRGLNNASRQDMLSSLDQDIHIC